MHPAYQFTRVDRIELYQISDGFGKIEESNVEKQMAVADEHTLTAIMDLWHSLPEQDDSARCHIPRYAVRFREGDKLLLEATICWQCNNIYTHGQNPDMLRVRKFSGDAETSQELLGLLKRLLSDVSQD